MPLTGTDKAQYWDHVPGLGLRAERVTTIELALSAWEIDQLRVSDLLDQGKCAHGSACIGRQCPRRTAVILQRSGTCGARDSNLESADSEKRRRCPAWFCRAKRAVAPFRRRRNTLPAVPRTARSEESILG